MVRANVLGDQIVASGTLYHTLSVRGESLPCKVVNLAVYIEAPYSVVRWIVHSLIVTFSQSCPQWYTVPHKFPPIPATLNQYSIVNDLEKGTSTRPS